MCMRGILCRLFLRYYVQGAILKYNSLAVVASYLLIRQGWKGKVKKKKKNARSEFPR
jgi:hypothetical protein